EAVAQNRSSGPSNSRPMALPSRPSPPSPRTLSPAVHELRCSWLVVEGNGPTGALGQVGEGAGCLLGGEVGVQKIVCFASTGPAVLDADHQHQPCIHTIGASVRFRRRGQ